MLLSELFSQSVLPFLLHLGFKLGVGSGQLFLDLSLEHDLGPLVVIVLAAEVAGQLPRIVTLENFDALNSTLFGTVSIDLDEK